MTQVADLNPRPLKPPRIKKAGVGRPHKIPHHKQAGRPFAITEEKVEQFLQEILAGADPKDAWLLTGLSESSWFVYQKRGRDEESGYFAELLQRIHRAEAEYIRSIYQKMVEHPKMGPGDWLAVLERRSKIWRAPKVQVEVDGELRGGNMTVINIVSAVPRTDKPAARPPTLEERRQTMLGPGDVEAQ